MSSVAGVDPSIWLLRTGVTSAEDTGVTLGEKRLGACVVGYGKAPVLEFLQQRKRKYRYHWGRGSVYVGGLDY